MKSYIEDLFAYLDTYESNPSDFKVEAFLQTYNGVYTIFQPLRQQRDKALDADHILLDKTKQTLLSGSDLRQLTVQVLITFFESEADTDGKTNKAYSYCRSLRPIKQDVPFFENHLIPLLFEEGSLNNNTKLNSFFLNEIARYLNNFGKSLQSNFSPEQFSAMSDPLKILELARRRLKFGEELISDRNSLEYDLNRINVFGKLAGKGRLVDYYLKEWKYLVKSDIWGAIKNACGRFSSKIKGAFTSYRYFRLITTQRNPAYIVYALIIILFILMSIYIPTKWNDYSDNQFQEFQKRAVEKQTSPGP